MAKQTYLVRFRHVSYYDICRAPWGRSLIVKAIFAAMSFMALAACQEAPKHDNELVQAAANLMLPVKGQSITDNLTPPTGKVSCQFANRTQCAGGTVCQPIISDVKVYTNIDFDRMTYDRCTSIDGCSPHPIEAISSPNPVVNISLGQIGVLVKYGPGKRFVDIATQGAFTFISDGVCAPAT